ncbi:ATP-NAD kinase family protein [Streptomyces brasiliensis]|uniref:ATP-NAD kinase n=1 Tax=Streptomyces brasiliensis TaxID=1954 RepID=A0A917P8M3_9ACTN|nr:ATP-NAD kinase family protein [Streptomyces brasiliensis]GGJ66856.1 ATP-NAD kinase [Streptomyces brasiliensis]
MSGPRLGVVVNPVAGIGGVVGLKGSDGARVQAQAHQRGAVHRSIDRTRRALSVLAAQAPTCHVVTVAGPMGEQAVPAGLSATVLGGTARRATTADDTRRACARLLDHGIDLLLFAGGDGTARDVLDVVGERCPVLGVPAGVKMHSAVFGTSPVTAGRTAAAYLVSGARLAPAEILDLDEAGVRAGVVRPRLYGALNVPVLPGVQGRKVGSSAAETADAAAIAAAVLDEMTDVEIAVLGPGTTVGAVAQRLGVTGTLTGVDAVDLGTGQLLVADAGEQELLAAVRRRRCRVLLSPLGGSGFLLGRGDQQVSAMLLREIGTDAVTVLATRSKLAALGGAPLWVDTGDAEVDSALSGMHRVLTGPGEYMIQPVLPADEAFAPQRA